MYSAPIDQYDLFDTVQFVKENSEKAYVDCIQSLIASKPFGNRKFYIFSFMKRIDDASGVKKMYHQPRLTRPEPSPGSTLMKVNPNNPEEATIIWTLPNEDAFGLYKQGKVFGNEFVHDCVQKYLNDPKSMCRPDQDDPSESMIREIYKEKHSRCG